MEFEHRAGETGLHNEDTRSGIIDVALPGHASGCITVSAECGTDCCMMSTVGPGGFHCSIACRHPSHL